MHSKLRHAVSILCLLSFVVGKPISDPYAVLGINKEASHTEIKQAFKKLAVQYHPDKNQASGATGRYIQIQEAYSILSDDSRRSEYDDAHSASKARGGIFSDVSNIVKGSWSFKGTQSSVKTLSSRQIQQDVFGSPHAWIIHVTGNGIAGRFAAYQWERIAKSLPPEIHIGRVLFSDDPRLALSIVRSARAVFELNLNSNDNLPAIIGFPPNSHSLSSGIEYKGPALPLQISDFVAWRLLNLKQIPQTKFSALASHVQKAFHKGKTALFIITEEASQSLEERIVGNEYKDRVDIWRISIADSEIKREVRAAHNIPKFPAVLVFTDLGLRPMVFTSSKKNLNLSEIIGKHQEPLVHAIRSDTVQKLGCGWGPEVSHQNLVQACTVLVGRSGEVMSRVREKLALFAYNWKKDSYSISKAFRTKALRLGWLDAGNQQDFLDFHLAHAGNWNQATSKESENVNKKNSKSNKVVLIIYQPGATQYSKYHNIPHRFSIFEKDFSEASQKDVTRWVSSFIQKQSQKEFSVPSWPPELVSNTFFNRLIRQAKILRNGANMFTSHTSAGLHDFIRNMPYSVQKYRMVEMATIFCWIFVGKLYLRGFSKSLLIVPVMLSILAAFVLSQSTRTSMWSKNFHLPIDEHL